MPTPLAEIDWNNLMQGDFGETVLPLLAVVAAVTVILLGSVIAVQWRRVQEARYNARLKEQMIERGFKAEEIIKVINSGVDHERRRKAGDKQLCCTPAVR